MNKEGNRLSARLFFAALFSVLLAVVMLPALNVMAKSAAGLKTQADSGQTQTETVSETQKEPEAEEQSEITRLQEGYRELLLNFDYGNETVYVIGHTSPDADTVCSAIGMANLLSELGVNAEPAITGKPNPQTRFILEEAGTECPKLLEDASGKQLYLVDHSSLTQIVNGGEDARIVGILDHHGMSGVSTTEMINAVSAPIGSTATLVYFYYEHCGIEIPPTIAKIIASGIISDCYDKQMILDSIALEELSTIAGITDLEAYANDMTKAKTDYSGMKDEEIYLLDYKHYESGSLTYGIACVDIPSSDDIPDMYERMITVMKEKYDELGMNMLFVMVACTDHTRQYIGYYGKDNDLTQQVADQAFGKLAEKKDGYYLFEPSVSRKKVIVPALDEICRTLTASPQE